MNPINLKIILGSTRQGRFSEKPGRWALDEIKSKSGITAELLDLRDYPMPFFDQPLSPAMSGGAYTDETVIKWAAKIGEADGFIIIAPEYNHGYPAVLKNALDSIYSEWNKKPVGFVGYGGAGGARSIEQLRQVAVELQMAPTRNAVHMPYEVITKSQTEPVPSNEELFASFRDKFNQVFEELIALAGALKNLRTGN